MPASDAPAAVLVNGPPARPLISSSEQRFPTLDGLRGASILLVMGLHFSPPVWHSLPEKILVRVFSIGWVGVDLFFVLSGLLITGLLIEGRSGSGYFRNFYIRRALRIFPLYYAVLASIFLIVPLFLRTPGPEYAELWTRQWWYWFYVVNIGQTLHGHGADWGTSHLWSLSVEEQFYLLWPFLVWLCTPRQLVMICLGCIVLAFASRVAIVIVSRDTWGAYTLMPARLDSLAIGGLIAVQARTVAGSLRVIRLAGPVAFGAGAVLLTHIFLERTLAPGDPFVVTVGLLCTALLSGSVVVFALLHRSGAFGRLLGSAFLRTVGRYSYGAYVLHLPLLHIVFMPWANRLYNSDFARRFGMVLAIGWMLSLICISLGLAALSYHLFESRFLRMKDRFRVAARAA